MPLTASLSARQPRSKSLYFLLSAANLRVSVTRLKRMIATVAQPLRAGRGLNMNGVKPPYLDLNLSWLVAAIPAKT